MRAKALLAGCLCLAAGLGACGGGSSSSTSTSIPTPAQSQSEASATQGAQATGQSANSAQQAARPGGSSGSSASEGGGAASGGSASGGGSQPIKTSGSPSGPGHSGAAKKHAAGAAGFIAPTGDNSIPEYGSEAPNSEQAEATASLRAFLEARATRDWSATCAHMGAQVQKQVQVLAGTGAQGCTAAYAKLTKGIATAALASPLTGGLAAFRVEGENAFALFYGPGEQQYMMPMVEEGGAWVVNQIAPIPYPPGASASAG